MMTSDVPDSNPSVRAVRVLRQLNAMNEAADEEHTRRVESTRERTTEFVRLWRSAVFDPELHHLFWQQLAELHDQDELVPLMAFDTEVPHVDQPIDMWAPTLGDGVMGIHLEAYWNGIDSGAKHADILYHQLPSGGRPRWVVIFDYINFRVIDKWGKRGTHELNLEDLRISTDRLGFLFKKDIYGV